MTLQLFLNDLSLVEDECAAAVAADRLHSLVRTLLAVEKVAHRHLLNAKVPFAAIYLGRGFPLAALRNEAASAEERVFLKTVADRSPWDAALAMRAPDKAGGAEYRIPEEVPDHGGADATALGLAYDLDGLAVSVATHPLWSQTTVDVDRLSLEGREDFVRCRIGARNASKPEHIQSRAEELRRAGLPKVRDGADLWERRIEILPNLRFVPTVRQQIEQLPYGDPNLDGALECLAGIDNAVGVWRREGTAHPVYPFSVTPESRSRINAGLVDIKDADGCKRTFSDHAKYGPDENRVHFIIEPGLERHALVGHVGRKLGIG